VERTTLPSSLILSGTDSQARAALAEASWDCRRGRAALLEFMDLRSRFNFKEKAIAGKSNLPLAPRVSALDQLAFELALCEILKLLTKNWTA
jgi:hypothetical protein